MLDDLKRERHAASPAKDLFKLAVYVVGLLILGFTIVAGTRCDGAPAVAPEAGGELAESEPDAPLRVLDPAELDRLVTSSGDEPYRYCAAGVEYLRDLDREGVLPPVVARVTPAELAGRSMAEARGQRFEVTGRVVDVSREVYSPTADASDEDRLWSIVLQGEDGAQAIVLKYALGSEFEEGYPREAKPPRSPASKIEPGQYVVARGVLLQERTGTLGETVLPEPAPAIFAGPVRIQLPPHDQSEIISGLDEALWGDVQDRYSRESRRWDEDAVFEVIQWARARGHEQCRADLRDGTLPWKEWGTATFEAWKKEVSVDRETPRPFTQGSRGQVYRTSGIIGEVLQFGWERIPANSWDVDEFQVLTMLSDHYQHVAMRAFLPFPIETYPGITGERAEHIRIYGVFIKNDTYDTKFKRDDGRKGSLPITAPMFVVLDIQRFPEEASTEAMRELMWWIAGSMIVFALLFYLVLIRGGSKQTERMEAHRIKIRQRVRAAGQGPTAPGRGQDEGEADVTDPPPDDPV